MSDDGAMVDVVLADAAADAVGDVPDASTDPPGRRRRRRWPVVAAVVVLLLAWGALSALDLYRAARAVKRGADSINEVRNELHADDITQERAVPPLRAAAFEFGQAHGLLGRPELAPLRLLPFGGRQLRSVDALSAAAAKVSQLGVGAVHQAHLILAEHSHTPEARLQLLRDLSTLANTTDAQLRTITLGPSSGLVGPLATRRAEFATDLTRAVNGLTQAGATADALVDFLGNNRNYLILAANNAEMRAGSGMFLQAGVITTDGAGKFALRSVGSTQDLLLPAPGPPMPADLAARWGFLQPNQEWRNLATTPRFDTTAELAARMWQAKTGQHVDGVLAVDVAALQAVLEVSGPITAGGITVDANSVVPYLTHDQYLGIPDGDPDLEVQRHDHLGVLATAVFDTVNATEVSLADLAQGLAKAADGRHILAWSSDPAVEQKWVTAGVGGRLGPDDVSLAVLNRGGNKLDPFLAVSSQMSFRPDGGGSVVEVTVQLRNQVPSGQPSYIAGTGREAGAVPGSYIGFVTLDVPARAGNLQVVGDQPVVAAGSDGPDNLVQAAQVVIPPGQGASVVFRFRLAGLHGQLRVLPSARIPAVSWQAGTSAFDDISAHVVSW